MRRRLSNLWVIVVGALSPAWAGPNADAGLYIDLNCATPQIDSVATLAFADIVDPAFWIGVRVADAKHLDSYGFQLAYDRSKLSFVRAVAAVPEEGYANFLESRGGSAPFFIGNLSVRDSGRISIGNSLGGSDSSKSPSGTGFLALIQFRPLASGNIRFALAEAQLLDWERTSDVPAALGGATVTLSQSVPIRSLSSPRPSTRWAGRTLEIELGERMATLWVANAQGKELFRQEGLRGRRSLDLSRLGGRMHLIWLQTAEGAMRLPVERR